MLSKFNKGFANICAFSEFNWLCELLIPIEKEISK